jgi:hypothetical protein
MQPLDVTDRSPITAGDILAAIASPAADPMPSGSKRQALPRCAPRTPHPSNGASAAVASIQAVHDQLHQRRQEGG